MRCGAICAPMPLSGSRSGRPDAPSNAVIPAQAGIQRRRFSRRTFRAERSERERISSNSNALRRHLRADVPLGPPIRATGRAVQRTRSRASGNPAPPPPPSDIQRPTSLDARFRGHDRDRTARERRGAMPARTPGLVAGRWAKSIKASSLHAPWPSGPDKPGPRRRRSPIVCSRHYMFVFCSRQAEDHQPNAPGRGWAPERSLSAPASRSARKAVDFAAPRSRRRFPAC